MSPLLETEFLFAVRPGDRLHGIAAKILLASKSGRPAFRFLGSAIWEMRTVLYSQRKKPNEIYRALAYTKRVLSNHRVDEEPIVTDDHIRADRLREQFPFLTFFDALHAATALGRRQILVSNDPVYDRVGVRTATFAKVLTTARK
jgi:hypothetical protein